MRKFLILCGIAVLVPATFLLAGGSALGAGAAVATTGAATAVTSTSATVNGTVNANGEATKCSFAYGLTTSYGLLTKAQNVGTTTKSVAVSASVTGLAPATAFHYQLVCSNKTGTVTGADQTLTTLPEPGRVAIAGRRLFISPTGVVGVFVACFGGNTCSGTLSLKSGNTTIAPNAHYSINNEKETVVFTKLTPSALAQLKAQGTLTATATAVDTDGLKSAIPFTLFRELL
jgi:hypothetical protein